MRTPAAGGRWCSTSAAAADPRSASTPRCWSAWPCSASDDSLHQYRSDRRWTDATSQTEPWCHCSREERIVHDRRSSSTARCFAHAAVCRRYPGADFLTVYIAEAHAADEWTLRDSTNAELGGMWDKTIVVVVLSYSYSTPRTSGWWGDGEVTAVERKIVSCPSACAWSSAVCVCVCVCACVEALFLPSRRAFLGQRGVKPFGSARSESVGHGANCWSGCVRRRSVGRHDWRDQGGAKFASWTHCCCYSRWCFAQENGTS